MYSSFFHSVRDLLNKNIEDDIEIMLCLKKFSGVKIFFRLADYPLKNTSLILEIDNDGLLKNIDLGDATDFETNFSQDDVQISLNNNYLNKQFVDLLHSVVMGDVSSKKSFIGKGLKVEGSVENIQALEPLLEVLVEKLKPFFSRINESVAVSTISRVVRNSLEEQSIMLKKSHLVSHQRKLRELRQRITNLEKVIN